MSQASMSPGFASFDSSNRSDTGGRRWGGKGSSLSSHLDPLRGLRKAIFLLWASAASQGKCEDRVRDPLRPLRNNVAEPLRA